MRKIRFFHILILVVIVFVNANCKKETPGIGSFSIPINPPPPPPPPNRPPVAKAGLDFTGILYSNSITLRGKAYNTDIGDTVLTTWSKIAGPPCTIVSPQQLITKVTNLLVGEYQFELLASDKYGATDRDTVAIKIISIEPITSPVDIFNLSWIYPMGCSIYIYDIYSNILSNTPLRVFIKFVNQAVWQEALPMSQYSTNTLTYYYDIDGNDKIVLYTDLEVNTNVDVKILF